MQPVEATLPQISESVVSHVAEYCDEFVKAQPFKHAMIENFFEPDFAERLLDQFPSFDPKLAINETGGLGGKAVNTKIREISPAYLELYEMIGSQPFLELMSRMTGIPVLLMDPELFGGGTHDNRHGQELDAHVDFNYDQAQKLHRRLNVIVYLNKEWKTEWGGAIEIHSNPRDADQNQIRAFDPLFNRCVMFETNEYSWHGFPRIELPPEKQHLSRKSISIYLYTRERPAHEIAPLHGTFYVQRPLPPQIRAGYTLTDEDRKELRILLQRRDDWIHTYQKIELERNAEIAAKNGAIADLKSYVRVPLTGYVLQSGSPTGVFPDQWVESSAEVEIQPLVPVSAVLLRGWRPETAPPAWVRLVVGDATVKSPVAGGAFEVTLKLPRTTEKPFRLSIETSPGRAVDSAVDSRDLAFHVAEIRAKHPLVKTLTKMLS